MRRGRSVHFNAMCFAAGVLATSKEKGVAADMVKFMGAPENAALVRKSGMEAPAR